MLRVVDDDPVAVVDSGRHVALELDVVAVAVGEIADDEVLVAAFGRAPRRVGELVETDAAGPEDRPPGVVVDAVLLDGHRVGDGHLDARPRAVLQSPVASADAVWDRPAHAAASQG